MEEDGEAVWILLVPVGLGVADLCADSEIDAAAVIDAHDAVPLGDPETLDDADMLCESDALAEELVVRLADAVPVVDVSGL